MYNPILKIKYIPTINFLQEINYWGISTQDVNRKSWQNETIFPPLEMFDNGNWNFRLHSCFLYQIKIMEQDFYLKATISAP